MVWTSCLALSLHLFLWRDFIVGVLCTLILKDSLKNFYVYVLNQYEYFWIDGMSGGGNEIVTVNHGQARFRLSECQNQRHQ